MFDRSFIYKADFPKESFPFFGYFGASCRVKQMGCGDLTGQDVGLKMFVCLEYYSFPFQQYVQSLEGSIPVEAIISSRR